MYARTNPLLSGVKLYLLATSLQGLCRPRAVYDTAFSTWRPPRMHWVHRSLMYAPYWCRAWSTGMAQGLAPEALIAASLVESHTCAPIGGAPGTWLDPSSPTAGATCPFSAGVPMATAWLIEPASISS